MRFLDSSIPRPDPVSPLGEAASVADSISRRRFATSVAAATLCVAATAAAEQQHVNQLGPKPEDLSVADWADVQARYQNVLRVYGPRLSAEQRRTLLHVLTNNQQMLASIRTFTVQNGDASACTLRLVTGNTTDHPQQ